MWRESEKKLRLVGVGAAYGFAAGALAVALLVWNGVVGPRSPRVLETVVPQRQSAPSPTVPSVDGLGPIDSARMPAEPTPAPTTGGAVIEADAKRPESIRELEDRDLEIPVEGVHKKDLTRSFADARSDRRVHEALDILAPRNTPVKAVEDGRVVKLFNSKAGGITIYQFDPSERYCYYYAHLERYADGLREGDRVRKGQLLGYVGTSGNAPTDTPHLHFAVFRLTAEKQWWDGFPIDPYDILR